jgi:hypothetical protein
MYKDTSMHLIEMQHDLKETLMDFNNLSNEHLSLLLLLQDHRETIGDALDAFYPGRDEHGIKALPN